MLNYDYIIIGAGAAGIQLVDKLLKDDFFRSKTILLIESNRSKKNKMWSFWEKEHSFPDDFYKKKWDFAEIGKEKLTSYSLHPYTYCTIDSTSFITKQLEAFENFSNFNLLEDRVLEVDKTQNLVLTENQEIHGEYIFDSRPEKIKDLKPYHIWLKQHFIGLTIETDQDVFDTNSVRFMDFSVAQKNNTRFMYVLPFSKRKALIEYTLFSKDELSEEEYEKSIFDYIKNDLKLSKFQLIEKEQGVIPMTTYPFENKNSGNYIKLGTAGGWTRASTGYTFKNIERKVDLLVKQLKRGDLNPKSYLRIIKSPINR